MVDVKYMQSVTEQCLGITFQHTNVELGCHCRITFQQTDQEDFDGTKYVHGGSKGGAQIEAQSHCSSELWTKGA